MKWKSWYAVRCCCTPKKIFGFVLLDKANPNEVEVTDKQGRAHTLKIVGMRHNTIYCTREFLEQAHPKTIKQFEDENTIEFAIYSENRPIEFWRNIEDFIEVKEERHA